jgi:hypothetical protein
LRRYIDRSKPPLTGLFSFGNGIQAIEFARGPFDRFFQTRFEIIE